MASFTGVGRIWQKNDTGEPGFWGWIPGEAACFIAQSVKKVLAVHKLDFGTPEAMWVIEVEKFPAVVTMDSHGGSQHAVIDDSSKKVLDELLAKPY